jgi:hypothetical protein
MSKINKPIINYTGRDFATIKEQLVNYAKKYYPETFRDFNEASFGSLTLDMVSYIGDILSFYTDYQANESYLDTALEFNNVLKLAKQLGYNYRPNAASFGDVSFFVTIPSQINSVSPDYSYAPILKKGSTFKSINNNIFTLIQDVDFKSTTDEILVASTNVDGTAPTNFALKAKGMVVSGELFTQNFTINEYKKFLQLEIFDRNLTEVISVFDADGNNYYEVDYLTQDVIYVPVLNTNSNREFARNILKPISVPRRFTVNHGSLVTTLQFGFGTEDNEEKVLDPTSVILDVFGKDYITDKSFDPTVLNKTTKLGIVPSNTSITVVYRRNSASNVNVPVSTLTGIVNPIFKFINEPELLSSNVVTTRNSLELTNEQTITGDVADMSAEELKLRARGAQSAQNRAVTKEDYISLCYNMPANFGQIKKANLTRDQTSFNGKNLNLFIISTDSLGSLTTTNTIVKQNLRTWINRYKMIGDTIDILDAKIINLQIKFSVVGFANVNKYDIINTCINTLSNFYKNNEYDIAEPFKISDVYKILNNVSTVVDTKNVEVTAKVGAGYSSFSIPFSQLISNDGRYLIPPEDAIFEIKFPTTDITGEVI